MVMKDGKHQLVRFVDLGEMHDACEKLSGNFLVSCYCSLGMVPNPSSIRRRRGWGFRRPKFDKI